ncbi:hypothetical protein [Alteribacillus sp. YIM 98480]|uniref:hypothetical protein n=1 Tax=Alteribacillus sp. YIM 98480 TaxID=2606599 RepID=UPI00131A96CB|nr:hypothetical protein [Alteribacillus sp. YIM 98480]
MKFLIDHTTMQIHRTPYAGDACGLNTTPLEKREGSHDEKYVNKLVEEKQYKKCSHCYDEKIYPS